MAAYKRVRSKPWICWLGLWCCLSGWGMPAAAQEVSGRRELPYLQNLARILGGGVAAPGFDPAQRAFAVRASAAYAPPERLAPLVSGDGAIADQFGQGLAFDGETLLIGARHDVIATPNRRLGVQSGTVSVLRWDGTQFVPRARWAPPDAEEEDYFGAAIALSGDWAVVGSPPANRNALAHRGKAYVYQRNADTWALVAQLDAPSGASEDYFGYAVAIDADARVLVVGAPGRDGPGGNATGAAYVYRETAGVWAHTDTLVAADGAAEDRFGSSVATRAGIVVVGAPLADSGAPDRGRVYVFAPAGVRYLQSGAYAPAAASAAAHYGERVLVAGDSVFVSAAGELSADSAQGAVYAHMLSGQDLSAPQRLLASDGQPDDRFGASLAFADGRLLVGAPGRVFGEGGAYLFQYAGGAWAQAAILQSFTGPPASLAGSEVALSGAQALLGAPSAWIAPNRAQGSVRSYRYGGGQWQAAEVLHRGDGAAFELFGFAVALSGDAAAVGSYLDDTLAAGDDAGSVSVFRRAPGGWVREAVLVAPDGISEDRFGVAVALSGDVLVVGAYWRVEEGRLNQGAVYIYERRDGSWVFVRRLLAFDGQANNFYGFSLAFDGTHLVVGAPGNSELASDGGAAYVYRRLSNGTWQLQTKLRPQGVADNALAGISVAVAGSTIAVGAPQDRVGEHDAQGRVYVYRLAAGTWTQQATLWDPDGHANDFFGSAVSLAAGQLLVGALGVSLPGAPYAGQAYWYLPNEQGGWTPLRRLQAPVAQARAAFGAAVALAPPRALVGASSEDTGAQVDRGRVYVFDALGSEREQISVLTPYEAGPYTYFGRSLALAQGSVLVGGPERMGDNPGEGSAWWFLDPDALFQDGFD